MVLAEVLPYVKSVELGHLDDECKDLNWDEFVWKRSRKLQNQSVVVNLYWKE